MHLKNKEENISGYFQVFGIFGFFLFCLKGFYFCPKCALHVTMRFILHFSLFWQCKKGLRKEQRGHFTPFTIQWVQHFPKPPFSWDICLAGGYTLPARESPGLPRRGQEMQWANQTTRKMLCDDAHLPGFTRKRWVNLSTGSSLALLPWNSLRYLLEKCVVPFKL